MNIRQKRKFEMYLKVRDFYNAHKGDFPAGSIGGVFFAALLLLIEQIEQLNAEKFSAIGEVGQSVDEKGVAKDVVKDWLYDISDMARSMAFDITGLENKFRMPRNFGVPSLIAAARAFAADANEYKAQFIEYGLPETFIADLTAATDALEDAYNATDTDVQERVGTNAAFVPLFKDADEKVRRLDPVVRREYRTNAAAFGEWNYASHVERPPKPKKPPTT